MEEGTERGTCLLLFTSLSTSFTSPSLEVWESKSGGGLTYGQFQLCQVLGNCSAFCNFQLSHPEKGLMMTTALRTCRLSITVLLITLPDEHLLIFLCNEVKGDFSEYVYF